MKSKRISYRRCRRKDLLPSLRLIMKSLDHLRTQTGKEPMKRRLRAVPPMFNHIFDTDSQRFYTAWRGDEIIGFAGALRRGNQWFLAWLFVLPRYQNKGVGRKLIEKIWDKGPQVVHSVATMTYNQQAVGLYSSFGMVPEALMTAMSGEVESLDIPLPSSLTCIENPCGRDLAWIKRFEAEVRGYGRPQEWRYWRESDEYGILLFKRGDKPVGYSLINPVGEIGPAAATTHATLLRVIGDSVHWCAEHQDRLKSGRISICCPGQNDELYRYLGSIGLRNVEMLLFQSEKKYADHRRYVPATLAIF
jgi:predicted acetyltransferase